MKYTNSHLKDACRIYLIVFYLGIVCFMLGIFILGFGFIKTKIQLEGVQSLESVLQGDFNHANKTAYIEITQIPQKISEDEYESYYLVTTETNTYISGMQDQQFTDLSHEVEQNGRARLEGMTKVIIDEKVKEDVKQYIENEYLHIRVTELTYGSVLKEGYIVNLILGGIIGLVSLLIVCRYGYVLGKQNHPKAKLIDDECNQEDAIWLNEYRIYLTKSFLVTLHYGNINAIDIKTIREARLYDKFKCNQTYRILELKTLENEEIVVSENLTVNDYMDEEEINYLYHVFCQKEIEFVCEVESYGME